MTGYLLLAASAFAAQALMFVPIVPLLVATGVLAAQGELVPGWAVVALTTGVAAGDLLWYGIGRQRGHAVMGHLCRISLEPSTCLRKAENLFARFGAAALLVAKFIPGLSTIALPLAGVFRMRPRRFIGYDLPSVFLWVVIYLSAGYFSSGAISAIGSSMPWSARWWLLAGVALLALYFAAKHLRRRRQHRQLRVASISVDDLRQRLASHDPMTIVDVRHPLEFEADPYTIPTAIYIPAEELAAREAEIPRDRDVVLYCTCPDEVTSAKEAMRLRARRGRRGRPLRGGFAAWRAAGLPVELRGPLVPIERRMLNAA